MTGNKSTKKVSIQAVSADTHSTFPKRPKKYVRKDASGKDLILSSEGDYEEYDEDSEEEINEGNQVYKHVEEDQKFVEHVMKSQDGDILSQKIDTRTIISGSDVMTVKAFNNQKLYEEAILLKGSVAGMSIKSGTIKDDRHNDNRSSHGGIIQE